MNQIDWSRLLEIQYWVEGIAGDSAVTPPVESDSIFFWFYVTLFTVLFSVGIILLTSEKFLNQKNPFASKFVLWGNNYLWMGVLGMIWFLLRQIEIGFLGSRVWMLVGMVWFLVLFFIQAKYFLTYFTLEWTYYKKTK